MLSSRATTGLNPRPLTSRLRAPRAAVTGAENRWSWTGIAPPEALKRGERPLAEFLVLDLRTRAGRRSGERHAKAAPAVPDDEFARTCPM
jgi:hypothetical protein